MARVAHRRRVDAPWPFGRKFRLWLSDQGVSLTAFARRAGIAQQTLHGWVMLGRRLPAEAVARIAAATRLPGAYWTDSTLPYPPALEYVNGVEDALAALKALPLDQLAAVLEMLRDPEDLRRTLSLRRAARGSPG